MGAQRVLFRFGKEGDARFLSHHDLIRLFERALRRAELPLRMTQGFNPHPRFSILCALPLGVEAGEEALEVEFEPPVAPATALERLAAQLPKGMSVTSAQALPEGARARVTSVAYEAELPSDARVGPGEIESFLSRQAIALDRPGRRAMDLRPALEALALAGGRVVFRLRVAPQGTPKPSEVLAALLGRPAAELSTLRVRRTHVTLTIAARRGNPAPAGEVAGGRTNATEDAD